MNFFLIGDGAIARYHRKAIQHVGGNLIGIVDPVKYNGGTFYNLSGPAIFPPDTVAKEATKLWSHSGEPICVVIASPSFLHREQIKFVLNEFPADTVIICEKPAFLPWDMPIDDDRINICLQLRYMPHLPDKADMIDVKFVRDDEYFKSWKGSPEMTGGLFFNLFIHYIDLAHRLNAEFEGKVDWFGEQYRLVKYSGGAIDLCGYDMQTGYNGLYKAILAGNGIHPKDLFYLDWILKRNSEIFGYGRNGIGKTIKIGKELL